MPEPDRCPGVLRTHTAVDGELARVRLPGGRIAPAALDALVDVARDLGDGHLELTSRGNIQLRALTDPVAAATRIAAAGLVPANEAAHNILASPLSGLVGGLTDVRPLIAELSTLLAADPAFGVLSGRFLFAVDDGRGDVLRHGPDLAIQAEPGGHVRLHLAGTPTGTTAALAGAAALLADTAQRFLAIAAGRWRVTDLTDDERARLAGPSPSLPGCPSIRPAEEIIVTAARIAGHPGRDDPRIGWLPQDDGGVTLGGLVPFGRIPEPIARVLAAVGVDVVFTPEREILLGGLDDGVAEAVVRVLAPMGVVFDAASPWRHVSACAGGNGCGRTDVDVRAAAAASVADGTAEREHWIGCERACGRPRAPHLLRTPVR